MSLTLIWIALFFAALDWVAIARGWKWVDYISKPAVMVCLIVWLGFNRGWNGALIWFSAGLVFSLAGDVFLMLPKERFIAGLISFLLAHIAYLIGLNTSPIPLTGITIILLVVVGLVSTRLYRSISQGLEATGNHALKAPVLLYTIVISLMLFSALLTFLRPSWSPGASLLIGFGALLFYLSDSLLAWNKFVGPIQHGDLLVTITYHTGQVLITLGAAVNFLS